MPLSSPTGVSVPVIETIQQAGLSVMYEVVDCICRAGNIRRQQVIEDQYPGVSGLYIPLMRPEEPRPVEQAVIAAIHRDDGPPVFRRIP